MKNLIVRSGVLVPHFRNPRFSASFAAAYTHEPDMRDEKTLGRLAAVVEVLGDARKSEALVDLIINTALDHYYSTDPKTETSPDKRFEVTIRAVNAALRDYAAKGYSGWVGKISSVLTAFTPDHLILSVAGSAEAILYRDHKYHHLATDKRSLYRAAQTFENIISGPAQVSDRILLTTPALMHQVAKSELEEFIVNSTPPAAITKIAESIRNLRQTDRVAAIVVEYITPEQAAAQPLPKASTAQEIKPTNLASDAKTLAQPLAEEAAKLAKSGAVKAKSGLQSGLTQSRTYLSSKLWPNLKQQVSRAEGLIQKKYRGNARRFLYLAIGVLLTVVIIATFGIKTTITHHHNSEVATKLAADQALYQRALQEETTGNTDQAKQTVILAQSDLVAIAAKPGTKAAEIKTLQQSLTTLLDKLNGLTRLSANALSKVNPTSLVAVPVNSKLYTFATDGTIQIYDIPTKQLTTSAAKLNGHVIDAAYSTAKAGIYILTGVHTVWLYSIAADSLANQAGTDGIWPDSPSIGVYGGTLYLLSSDRNQVWKYPAAAGGFAASVVLLDKIGPATNLSVNGSIYLISGTTLKRYLSGSLSGSTSLPSICAKPSHAVGSNDDTTVAVSCGNNQIIIFNVSGNQLNLTTQMSVDNVQSIKQLSFTPSANNQLFFTSAGRLYQLSF